LQKNWGRERGSKEGLTMHIWSGGLSVGGGTLEKTTRTQKCDRADPVPGCFGASEERRWSRKKPSVLRELDTLVESYCILFLSDLIEDRNILNYSNLTHGLLCTFHCHVMYLFH